MPRLHPIRGRSGAAPSPFVDPAGGEGAAGQVSFDLEALTPIYKGSAKQDGIDERYPFRGPSLRGQLRTWWRATQSTTSVGRLLEDENRLFGGVYPEARASRVSVGVVDMHSTAAHRAELKRYTGGSYSYALWVDRDNGRDPLYHVDARGTVLVTVQMHDTADEPDARLLATVRPALEAMVMFGGSGSRTRRGMGRLWSKELFGAGVDGPEDLAERIAQWCPDERPRPWPSLAGARVLWWPRTFARPGEAVDHALEAFKDLRGMRSLDNPHFDGSHRLPEAQRDWVSVRHGEDLQAAFTAALGMPLAYRSTNGHLDGTTIVEPRDRDRDRLPSPVHLRPVPLARGGYAAVVLALRPWFAGAIQAKNRRMNRNNGGSLDPHAIDVLVEGFRGRDWMVHGVVGGRR